MSPKEKQELVNSYKYWWHSIDFGDGVVSVGQKNADMHQKEKISWFPEDFFIDKRVLDVGTWDGYYAFYAEQQKAAEVIAVDKHVWTRPNGRSKRGFDIAKQLLNSRVKDYVLDIEEMNPELLGKFDSIIFAGVFYHLQNPYKALEILDTLLKVNGRIMLESTMRNCDIDKPLLEFHPKKSLNNDSTNFWSPNGLCLKLMFEEIGDYRVESLSEGDRGVIVVRKQS
jgi:tRNA (mo5U34)-methyltransferase